MKTMRNFLLLLLVVLAAASIAVAQGWQTATVDSGGMVGEYTSLALDSGDSPYISYYDSTNTDLKDAFVESSAPAPLGDSDGGGCFISSF